MLAVSYSSLSRGLNKDNPNLHSKLKSVYDPFWCKRLQTVWVYVTFYHIIGDMAQLGCFSFTRLSQYVEVLHNSRNLYSRGNHCHVSRQWSYSFHKCAYFHCSWTTCSPWSSSKVPCTLENVLHKLRRSHGLTRSCQSQRWRRAQLDLGEKIAQGRYY